jgi:hypothetical protein
VALELWPATLPQSFLTSAYGEALPEKNVIGDEYNVGPPIYRRRTTSSPAHFAGQMFMTAVEWETLSTFFHTTLFDGVIRFLFPPQGYTDEARYWISRFISPPTRRMSDADDGWVVSLSLERLGIGAGFLYPASVTDPDSFYRPTVIWDQFVTVPKYTNTSTLHSPRVQRAQAILPGLYQNTPTFYSPVTGAADTVFDQDVFDMDVFS